MLYTLCECSSVICRQHCNISIEEYKKMSKQGCVIIHNDCDHGPDDTDVLVSRYDNYSVYKEAK